MELYGVSQKPILDPALTDESQSNNTTKEIDGKIVMRPSSLDVGCWYQYAQTALLKKKQKPKGASQLGTSYHYALDIAYSEKLLTDSVPNMEDIKEIAVFNFETALEKYDLQFISKNDSPAKAKTDIAGAVDSYKQIIPNVTPIATEKRFTVGLPKPSSIYSAISGSIDLIAKAPVGEKVVDYKLTSKKKTPNAYRVQQGTYELMAKTLGYNITVTELHNAVRSRILKTKTAPVEQHIINPTRDTDTYNLIQYRVTEFINKGELYHYLTTELSIDKETAIAAIYPTTSPERNYLCSPDWCGFWHEGCPINNPTKFSEFSLVDLLKSKREV